MPHTPNVCPKSALWTGRFQSVATSNKPAPPTVVLMAKRRVVFQARLTFPCSRSFAATAGCPRLLTKVATDGTAMFEALEADPTNPFMPTNIYPTRDERRMLLMNIYPALKTKALAFLGCNDDPRAIGEAVRKWDAFALEDAMSRTRLQATVVRSPKEFLSEEQGHYVERMPLIEIEKIAGSAPEPFGERPTTPLSGVRALGLSHVIAGSGFGRALAYHGADVLNIWRPNDFEMDFNYYTANIGMRSSIMDIGSPDEMARFKALLREADVFFANRRPGFIERMGLSTDEFVPASSRWISRLTGPKGRGRTE
jgi:hypothetical protein